MVTAFCTEIKMSAQPATLLNIATERMRNSDQVRFLFSESVDTDYTVDAANNQCVISLFNLSFELLNVQNLVQKLKSASSNIASIAITKTQRPNAETQGTAIKISFYDSETHLNFQVLDTQFIIDIISPRALRSGAKTSNVISQAHNTLHGYAHYAVRQLV